MGAVMERCSDHDGCMKDIRSALWGVAGNEEAGVVFKSSKALSELKEMRDQSTRHRAQDEIKFESIQQDVISIKDALIGTTEKKGLITELKENTDYIKNQKEGFSAKINWVYKALITAGVTYMVMNIHVIVQSMSRIK